MSKFGNEKIVEGNLIFDSKKEYARWKELQLLQRAGEISSLERQVKYELIPTQKDEKGNVIEKAVNYIADFRYTENWEIIVEDAKGMRTKEYIIKRKLMLWRYGIRIREV